MRLIKVGSASMNTVPMDWPRNKRIIMEVLRDARDQGITVVGLHELCVTGYELEDDFQRIHVQEKAWQIACEIAEETRGWGLIYNLGLPVLHDDDRLYNCNALVVDGKIIGLTAKRDLAGDGNYYEPRQFKPWPRGKVDTITIGSGINRMSLPIGDIHYKVGNLKIGFEVCQEAFEEDRTAASQKKKGVKLFINPSASHSGRGRYATRRRIVQEGSRSTDAIYLYANQNGCNGRLIFDGGAMVADGGEMRAVGKRFSFRDYVLVSSFVDVDLRRTSRSQVASFEPNPHASNGDCVESDFSYPKVESAHLGTADIEAWETARFVDEEESVRGPALAISDWMEKAKLQTAIVSLSGGRDSALVACQVKYMVDLAVAELGFDGFKQKFAHVDGIEKCRNNKQLVARLLKTLFQGIEPTDILGDDSGNKQKKLSQATKKAAQGLAKALGAKHYYFNVTAIVTALVALFIKVTRVKLSWEDYNVSLQNVQARVRGVIAWFMANVFRGILLTTSNRSEGCTGYWTAGGDGEGGLAPVSGMSKDLICDVLEWMQAHGPDGLEPVPELKLILELSATAQLEPEENKQTDEDQLGPFPVLEVIEAEALLHNRSPLECLLQASAEFPQYSTKQMARWVHRWFRLWSINQWKREQATAGLHTDVHNVDPRCGRRAPILSAGFRTELDEMWEHVKQSEKEKKVKRALLRVDVMPTFMEEDSDLPGSGELPVAGGAEIVPLVNDLSASDEYDLVIDIQDAHPHDHGSFASQHEGVNPFDEGELDGLHQVFWTDHGREGTPGGSPHPDLDLTRVVKVFLKGQDRNVDSYSGFWDNGRRKSTGLAEFLRGEGVTDVDVVGLALDYCVGWTGKDGVEEGFNVRIIRDATRAIGDADAAVKDLESAGIEVIDSSEVLSS